MTGVTVLAYHAVGACPREDDTFNLYVDADAFAEQMAFLARARTVVSLAEALGPPQRHPRPAVALTFDDAYRSVVDIALPILARHGFPATVFAPTAFLGDRNRWDPPSRCPLDVMDAGELRACEAAGLRVESHGHRHIDMRLAPADEVRADLSASCEALVDLVGRAPRHLAWPFRTGSPAARQVAAELGFQAAFSIDLPADGPLALPRVQITPLDGARLFKLKSSGHYLAVRHSRLGRTGWAVVGGAVRRMRGGS